MEQAQRYTEDFAAVKGIFGGLYIATPVTYVLTHTSQGAAGITTRSGDSLKTFQDTILAQPRLTNLGIMKSPGTGSMILSMYDPIFDGGRCIGYVGAGVYASHGDFQALSQGTMEQAASIGGLVSNVSAITSQIQSSTAACHKKPPGVKNGRLFCAGSREAETGTDGASWKIVRKP